MAEASVCVVSATTIHLPERMERSRWELTAWDVALLSGHYIQKGLLFSKPPAPLDANIERLQTSLSHCLLHFYPLSGRLATDSEAITFVDCNDSGAQFVIAKADGVRASNLLNSAHVPAMVKSLFPLDGAINFDGHSLPLLAVQVTELVDGLFIGCSFNHAIGDGESFWHFFNSWSELSRGSQVLSRPPLTERPWTHRELGPVRFLFSEDDMERFQPPPLQERIFHFSAHAVVRIKAKANEQVLLEKGEVSSLQALLALMWRSITRARKLALDQTTRCSFAVGSRNRLNPPLTRDYFGNCIQSISTQAKVGELLGHDLGWAARALHEAVACQTGQTARDYVEQMVKNPLLYRLSTMGSGVDIAVGSSPRFEVYDCDFGWGKSLAVLVGGDNKFDGKLFVFPGRGGEGGIDFQLCLLPHFMKALELDEELSDGLAPFYTRSD